MLQTFLNFYLQAMQSIIDLLCKYQLPLLCILGGIGAGVYTYGVRKLSRFRAKQREGMRLHPDDPVPELPENARQSALAYEIAGFIILLVACLSMAVLGHFDKYLALIGLGR
ncbi:MAG: hypothetical protein NC305_12770 [Lachnospiraceae bacterium]|nr:hypothetical protein [Lachnospiraceae bacterium]